MLKYRCSAAPVALFVSLSFACFVAEQALAQVTKNTAIIFNSGSTNTIGYRIFVSPSGEATYWDGRGEGHRRISRHIAQKFFADLKRAAPLSHLSVKQTCVKSASFGATTKIRYDGEETNDISCPDGRKSRALFNDAQRIARLLGVRNVPKSEGKDLPPINY